MANFSLQFWKISITAKELSAACTTPILAMKLNVLLHGSWNVFMLIETHSAWPPPT